MTVENHWHSETGRVMQGTKPETGCGTMIAVLLLMCALAAGIVFGSEYVKDGIDKRDQQIERLEQQVRILKAGPK